MDAKRILKSFWLLGNVFRIVALQALSLVFISYAMGLLAMAKGVRNCPPRPEYLNWYFWIILVFGLLFSLVSIYYIVKPSVWMQKVDRNLAFSATDINIPFFSTHPLFIFLDFLFFIPAITLFQSGRIETMCSLNFEWGMGWTVLLVAIFYPIFRLFCWNILGIKIEAMTLKKPWMPIVMWYILSLPFFVYFTYTYMDKNVLPKLRVPVVNEMTFKGGFKKNPQFGNGIVRVQGKLVREIAKCGLFGKDPKKNPYPFGTVLLDMGKRNGQIMVQAKKPSQVEDLEFEAKNKKDKIFEAFGRLSKLPNPEKRLICGIGKADSEQKGGLALLEIEMP